MKQYEWTTNKGKYRLELMHYDVAKYGRRKCQYALCRESPHLGWIVIFSGREYTHAFKDPEGVEAAEGLMGFLTLKPGDTDDEYFKDYTEWQMAFAIHEAEDLEWEVTEWYEEVTGKERR